MKITSQTLFKNIKSLVEASKQQLLQTINSRIIETYFSIGKLIVEYEQQGKSRAAYAANTLQTLSSKLTKEFGKGFSVDNLENMRKFYITYKISETVSRKSIAKFSSQKSETLSRKSSVPVFKLSWS